MNSVTSYMRAITTNFKYTLPLVFIVSFIWFVLAGGTPNRDGTTTKMQLSQSTKHSAYVTALVFCIMYFSKCWSFEEMVAIAPPQF